MREVTFHAQACVHPLRKRILTYLEEQLKDGEFAVRFGGAGEAWEVAVQFTGLRKRAGLAQKELEALLRSDKRVEGSSTWASQSSALGTTYPARMPPRHCFEGPI